MQNYSIKAASLLSCTSYKTVLYQQRWQWASSLPSQYIYLIKGKGKAIPL